MSPLRDDALRFQKASYQRCDSQAHPVTASACSSTGPAPQLQSHNIKPGWRRLNLRGCTAASQACIFALIVLAMLCGISEAGMDTRGFPGRAEDAEMAQRGEIIMDRRPMPRVRRRELRFLPRQGGSRVASTTATALLSSATAASSTAFPEPPSTANSATFSPLISSTFTTSSSLMIASSVPTNAPLPKPFDTSLGSNFTSSACPTFFDSFLNNATFISCLPFSLLLENSNSFFLAEKSMTLVTRTLDATCKVDFPSCSSTMSTLAGQIRDDANCGQDYADQNSLVVQAYNGLVSYAPLYQAGCLKDSQGSYCFANAVTNASSPSDPFPYYLPLGFSLPGASRPTCSSCLQQTMNIFAAAASNLTQPVSLDYNNAAVQIDQVCGPTFVNSTVTPMQGTQPSNSAATHLERRTATPLLLMLAVGFLAMFI